MKYLCCFLVIAQNFINNRMLLNGWVLRKNYFFSGNSELKTPNNWQNPSIVGRKWDLERICLGENSSDVNCRRFPNKYFTRAFRCHLLFSFFLCLAVWNCPEFMFIHSPRGRCVTSATAAII